MAGSAAKAAELPFLRFSGRAKAPGAEAFRANRASSSLFSRFLMLYFGRAAPACRDAELKDHTRRIGTKQPAISGETGRYE